MTIHELKIKTTHYLAVKHKLKTFEVRKNDRDFKVGELLKLREIKQKEVWTAYTGQFLVAKIVYILPGGQYGIADDYCVLGIEVLVK